MKKLSLTISFACALVWCSAPANAAPLIGPSPEPAWAPDAQTRLGWNFGDPKNPGASGPLPGWDEYLDTLGPLPPEWDYDASREEFGTPAQWYARIPNWDSQNPYKLFWLSWVCERDNTFEGPRLFTNLSWEPFDSYQDFAVSEEWFDINGNPTTDAFAGVYARVTVTVTMFPNPLFEDIWLGTTGSDLSVDGDSVFDVTEVYLLTQCVPEPATLGFVVLGSLGLLIRRRR